MKKVVFYMMLLVMSIGYAYAQGKADIKFEQTTHNFGTFSEAESEGDFCNSFRLSICFFCRKS